ncbi:MAG: hypothetical protein GC136_00140 [Alphaproteobacteria bacterium]|nr:hypothetical protein [Alphaproteobacteria bacterium]
MKPLVVLLVLLLSLSPALAPAHADELSMPPEFLGRWRANDLCLGNIEITKDGYFKYSLPYVRFHHIEFLEKYRILHIDPDPVYRGDAIYGLNVTWHDPDVRSARIFSLQRAIINGRTYLFFQNRQGDFSREDFKSPLRDNVWQKLKPQFPALYSDKPDYIDFAGLCVLTPDSPSPLFNPATL